MGCGDLRNALVSAAKLTEAYHYINVHMSDDSHVMVIARNAVLVYIMLSNDFNPDDPTDVQYLWDVWYSFLWTGSTRKRFIKDVKQMLAIPWETSATPIFLDNEDKRILKKILHFWISNASLQLNAVTKAQVCHLR